MNRPGRFITFEGVEGSGKTTQLQLLAQYLRSRGCDVLATREPGGVPIAEAIRHVLLNPENLAMAPMTELLLYEAARAQHVAERILPALDEGKIVLSDRFSDSTTAYQCAGRGLSPETVRQLHAIATGGVRPDLTIVLDLCAEAGLARATREGSDRIEREALTFHERVRAEFLRVSREEPERVRVVDASGDVDAIAAAIRAHVDALLEPS